MAKFFQIQRLFGFLAKRFERIERLGTSLRRKGIYYPQTLESTHFSVSLGIVQWIMELM